MKATLFLTSACNLRCDYCYVARGNLTLSHDHLALAVDFAFDWADPGERLDFGLFGGEPLLVWPLALKAVKQIRERAEKTGQMVGITLATNATLLDRGVLADLLEYDILLQASCDGVPHVQDRHRRFPDGRGSSGLVAENLALAAELLPNLLVNMVYGPDTHAHLPESIAYLRGLGINQMVLNPDYSAPWTTADIQDFEKTCDRITALYLGYYQRGEPCFISFIDEKLAVVLRGGYRPSEQCRMGEKEFAFSPQGVIFPCERLVGDGGVGPHSIGHLAFPFDHGNPACTRRKMPEMCQSCSVSMFCMNWCGCSNFFGTGDYDRPSAFICASERMAVKAARRVLDAMDDQDPLALLHHYAGRPMANSAS